MRWSIFVLALSGCSFRSSSAQGPDGNTGGDDASMGNPDTPDGPPGCKTFSSYTNTCLLAFTSPVMVGHDQIYNTDSHILADFPTLMNPMQLSSSQQMDIATVSGPMNAILASAFTISGGATLHVVGTKAFGLLSNAAITLDGDIDGSDDLGNNFAALFPAGTVDATHCAASTPATPGDHVGGAAGGGGGGFRGHGGRGQDGDNNEGGEAGAPEGAKIAAMPAGVRGGCPGGDGGATGAGAGGEGGVGGRGGAGVYVASGVSVTVHGGSSIHVGGGGGDGGHAIDGGAGGGGSGGMIVLESPAISIQGTLAANGGGGGGGAGGNNSGTAGQPGQPSSTAANGATAISPGGGGSHGAAANVADGEDNATPAPGAAGGGGGGAGGYIVLLTANPDIAGGATISPN